jgi:hypothetical protein
MGFLFSIEQSRALCAFALPQTGFDAFSDAAFSNPLNRCHAHI